jgi:NAD(P)-dependent dehydrogenase (short-subunit alcohol dehydrogenase family)
MPDAKYWSDAHLPDLAGKTVVITGANSGIGYEAAAVMAAHHANTILACRSMEKAHAAAANIRSTIHGAAVEVMELDLAQLASVHAFAAAFHRTHRRLDVLCNNAGVMAIPYRRTADGFEMQFGTNHLGHFALTGLLLDLLISTPGARVVTVSSSAHHIGWMRFDDLQGERSYQKWLAYGQSKLANLLFAFELQRRCSSAEGGIVSVGCTPGYADTNLQSVGPRMDGSALMESMWSFTNRWLAVSAAMGALPTLYAATAPELNGGEYVGPKLLGAGRGYPAEVWCAGRAHDPVAAARLWEVSEQLTAVHYAFK